MPLQCVLCQRATVSVVLAGGEAVNPPVGVAVGRRTHSTSSELGRADDPPSHPARNTFWVGSPTGAALLITVRHRRLPPARRVLDLVSGACTQRLDLRDLDLPHERPCRTVAHRPRSRSAARRTLPRQDGDSSWSGPRSDCYRASSTQTRPSPRRPIEVPGRSRTRRGLPSG